MPRPKLKLLPKPANAEFIKYDGIGTRLQAVARKVDLLSIAVTGLMTIHDDDEAWPLRDAADEIHSEITAIVEELQS
jgi:hypothetical protein